jgi:hypothetical protein
MRYLRLNRSGHCGDEAFRRWQMKFVHYLFGGCLSQEVLEEFVPRYTPAFRVVRRSNNLLHYGVR